MTAPVSYHAQVIWPISGARTRRVMATADRDLGEANRVYEAGR